MNEAKWENRRRVMFVTLAFCFGLITWLLVWGEPESPLHETMTQFSFVLIMTTVGSYVFGAAWENRGIK